LLVTGLQQNFECGLPESPLLERLQLAAPHEHGVLASPIILSESLLRVFQSQGLESTKPKRLWHPTHFAKNTKWMEIAAFVGLWACLSPDLPRCGKSSRSG
jgi:hypothetical protein